MVANYPVLALLIASLSLMMSALSLFFGRKDKTAEVVQALRDEIASSQKSAMDRMEFAFNQRLGNQETLGAERHNANTQALGTINSQVARMDEAIKQIPNHRDIDQLQASISNLTSQVSKLEGALEANTRLSERINDFLMRKGSE